MKTRSTVTVRNTKGRPNGYRSGCTHMDEANFSKDGTCKRQDGSPYSGRSPQTKLCNDCCPSSESHILGVSNQHSSAVGDTQEGAPCKEICRNADMALTTDEMNESTVEKKYDGEQQCTTNPPHPARGDLPKSNISDILQHHLSKEEFLQGEGIDCETLPEISNADDSDEAAVKSSILRYIKSSWPEEQAPGLTGLLDPERDGEGGSKPSGSPTTAEESTSELGEPAAAGDGSHPASSSFLTEAKGPSHKQKGGQWQAPPNQQTEKAGLGRGFQCDQVHRRLSDFSSVVPAGKIPENNIIDKPLPTDKQDHFSLELRDRLILVQDILESLSRSNTVEKEEQERKASEPPRETEMEPLRHIYQERLAGTEPETSLPKLTSASQKNLPVSSSYIFQRISHGKKMCQKLREQADRLRSKVQEFSRSVAQDSPRRHVRDKRLALEKLQGCLTSLEQEFVANKEKHLTWKQQVCKHEVLAVGDFDPERKVEGDMFRLEMLLEEVKEKMDEGKHTSASSPPASSPATLADLPPTSSPPSDENFGFKLLKLSQVELPLAVRFGKKNAQRSLKEAEKESPVRLNSLGKQNMEKKGHRRISCGRFPAALQQQALHSDSNLSPDTELSCYLTSGTGPWSNKCETCGTKIPNSPRSCQKEPLREFHYRYNSPGQNYSNHEGGSAFVQLHFLNENKNSSPPCSKPNWIYSESASSKPSQDEHEPVPGKISGSKSSGNLSSIEETKSEGLNSALDNALRTAIILKETTDRMIRTIAEDLAKVQRKRNQLKY